MFNRLRNAHARLLCTPKARRFNHDYIGTEHFIGLIREGEGVAAAVLQN